MKKPCLALLSVCCTALLFSQQFPLWVANPAEAYPKSAFETAVGEGISKKDAEMQAYANLSLIFGVSVKLDARATQRYVHAGGAVMESKDFDETISTSSEHDLLNARIPQFFFDEKKNRWYALAVINRAETVLLLHELIRKNNVATAEYLERAQYEVDPLYRFSLLDMAAVIAGKTETYVNQHNVLSPLALLTPEHTYRSLKSRANAAARTITYGVKTAAESTVQFAIETALSDLGLRVSQKPSYVFNERLTYDGAPTGFGMYVLQYTLLIDLLDSGGVTVKTFTFKGKEGGSSESDALRVLCSKLGRDIAADFANQFTAFMNSLLE